MKHLLILLCALPLLAQSVDKAQVLSQHMAAALRRQARPVDDPALATYAADVLRRLKSNTPVELVHSDSPRPIALPGGPLFLPVPLLLQATGEAELAITIAHALGHAAAPLTITNDRGPSIIVADPHGLVPKAFEPRRAEAEAAADRFAAALLNQASLNPEAFRAAQAAARVLLPPRPAPTLHRR
jgi:hypothetical protein